MLAAFFVVGDESGLIPGADLAAVGINGKPRVGYYVPELCRRLAETLGYGKVSRAVLVGAGHLGTAIANYPGFPRMGLRIVALFDASPQRIGRKVGGRTVKDVRQLAAFLAEHKPEVGIITVPPSGAQEVARILVSGGVKGIWDFSGARLEIPDGVVINHADLAAAWSVLSHRLKARKSR